MSSSVADSSHSEIKNEKGNKEDPGISSVIKKNENSNTRYFIIKSLNHQNIELSVTKGLWATQVMNEPILDEAFQTSTKVILIFSVNMSGYFQGYAEMTSAVGWRRDNIWSNQSGAHNKWGRSFQVKWLKLSDLPFDQTLHLKNPLNGFKPVKISRDCQELPRDIGEALCELIDGNSDGEVELKRDGPELGPELTPGPYIEPSLRADSLIGPQAHMLLGSPAHMLNMPPTHMLNMPPTHMLNMLPAHMLNGPPVNMLNGPPAHMLYPSMLYQNQAMYLAQNMCGPYTKRSRGDMAISPHSTITEDDLLEMTYEEYLEAHSGLQKRSYHCAPGPTNCVQKSPASEGSVDQKRGGSSSKKRR